MKNQMNQERRKAGKRSGTGGHLQKICSAVFLPVFLFSLFAFSGCATTPEQRHANVVATDQALVDTARNFGAEFIANTAQNATDALIKNDFKMSSGDALRSLENTAIDSGLNQIAPLVKNLLATWLPDKSHWQAYTDQVTRLVTHYVAKHPGNPAAVNTALESIAQGLQQPINPAPSH